LEKLPWLMLAAASCVVTYWAQRDSGAVSQALSLSQRVANALVSYVAYLGQFFYPAGLAALYPLQDTLPGWKIVASVLLLAGISAAALVFRSKHPHLLVGWLWYLGMLVPVIGFVQIGVQAMADRYTYLPQIGLYIALAWEAEYVSRHWPYRRRVSSVTAALVVIGLGWSAWRQASYWKDDETLWRHTLACTSGNWFAENGLGIALSSRGRGDEALDFFRDAVNIKPNYAEGHYNLGTALVKSGQVDEAIMHFVEALRIKPRYAEAESGLGVAFSNSKRPDEAVIHFRNALGIQPLIAERHFNLGLALAAGGKVDDAIACYQGALKIKPYYAEAHYNLALALAKSGRVDEAIAHWREAADSARQQGKLALAELSQAKIQFYESRKSPSSH